jgi:hypothetical protein
MRAASLTLSLDTGGRNHHRDLHPESQMTDSQQQKLVHRVSVTDNCCYICTRH